MSSGVDRGPVRTLALVAGLIALAIGAWIVLAPPPRLNEKQFEALTSAGQFTEAEQLLASHLKRSPRDGKAQFLLGQLLVERSDRDNATPRDLVRAESERALEALDRVGTADRTIAPAVVSLLRGKALYRLGRWDDAEQSWREALQLDPSVPEAGWALLDLYYLELRRHEARSLALQLLPNEPSRHDRAQLLLELVRQDAIRPDPQSLVDQLGPALQAAPGQIRAGVALGVAQIRSSQIEPGLAVLRDLTEQHPDDPIVWDGYLTGLDLANQHDEIGTTLDGLPPSMVNSPRFARHVGLAAQGANRWTQAVTAYKLALDDDPGDFETAVRLARALRFAEQPDEAVVWDRRIAEYRQASGSLLALYDEANAIPTLGEGPHDALYDRLAMARDRMWHSQEANAWRAMISGSPPAPATTTPAESAPATDGTTPAPDAAPATETPTAPAEPAPASGPPPAEPASEPQP